MVHTQAVKSPIHITGRGRFEIERGRTPQRSYRGGGNQLIPSSNYSNKRKRVPLLDTDLYRNVSDHGRRFLLSLGRHIYFSCDSIRQAVNEQAEYAGSIYLPDYRGADREWKNESEEMMYQHDRWCDIAGPPYTMGIYRRNLIKSIATDGDMGTVYVLGEDGQPYLQTIPSHRISSVVTDSIVKGGPFDGAGIIDGVIVGPQLQPLGYRVITGEGSSVESYRDIPTASMCLHFIPEFPGQLRGLSKIGLAAWSIQDLNDSKRFELLAQKAGAGRVFQEWNEEGEAQINADFMSGPTSSDTTANTPTGLWREEIDEGINTYFKANSGSRIEAVKFDRPNANQRAFAESVMREVLGSLGTTFDFLIDATKIGGHSSRVMLEKINRSIRATQDLALEPAVRRFDAFRLGTWITNGQIRSVEDWHNIEYQGPPAWTGDRRYEAEADAMEVKMGIKPRSKWAGSRGEALVDVRDMKQAEVEDLFRRAKDVAERWDVTIEMALARLEDDGVAVSDSEPASATPEPERTNPADPTKPEPGEQPKPSEDDDE